MNGRVNSLQIQTPEGCTFSLLLAGPITRFLALLVDLLCVLAATVAVAKALSFLELVSRGLGSTLLILTWFVLWFGYGIVLEWFCRGRTVGKRLLRLRVVDEHGLGLTFSQIVIRNLLRLVDMLPMLYLVGGVFCLATRRAQRLGDLVANTVVIRTPKISPPDLSRVGGHKFNSFRQYPRLAARLRQVAGSAEAQVALQALRRRETLDAAARVALFDQIAGHFKSMVQFPQEVTDGLSDEQYVRNVVEILFDARYKPA